MDEVTVAEEKKYTRMKRIVIVSSIIAGANLAIIFYIIFSLYLPMWLI